MRPPQYYRRFNYDRNLLPNRHLAALEAGVADIDAARERSGASVGYPAWNLIYNALLAHLHPDKFNVIVETGTNIGCTTIILAQALKDSNCRGRVFTVEIERDLYERARENFARAGVAELIEAHLTSSHTFLKEFAAGGAAVRVALLDASHLFDDVMKEFEAILPLLEPDSLVIFDNTYQIAEPNEDQRVHGALKEIVKRHGGSIINFPYVSWYTPGMAIWQREPFPGESSNGRVRQTVEQATPTPKSVPMTIPVQVSGDMISEGLRIWKDAQMVFPHTTYADLKRGLDNIARISGNIIGRHCGDTGDKLSQYLSVVEFCRASGGVPAENIEIGTLFGGSCLMKLLALQDLGARGKVVCIDPMEGFYDRGNDPLTKLPVNAETLFGNLRRFGYHNGEVELRRFKSDDPLASAGLKENSYSTLLIDGDHSYAGVRRDWESYHRFVRLGGMVLLDDYHEPIWPEITKFADELTAAMPEGWRVCGQLGTTLILQRAS